MTASRCLVAVAAVLLLGCASDPSSDQSSALDCGDGGVLSAVPDGGCAGTGVCSVTVRTPCGDPSSGSGNTKWYDCTCQDEQWACQVTRTTLLLCVPDAGADGG